MNTYKLISSCVILMLIMPWLLNAQYIGGTGRGDASIGLYNVSLQVQTTVTELPIKCNLDQNYPNPFNPITTISYTLPHETFVSLKIFNVLGEEVKILIDQKQTAGNKSITWNGFNNHGREVGSGIYIYQLKAGSFSKSMKLTFLK